MEAIRKFLENLVRTKNDEKGQTVIEYILVIVLIALVLVAAFQTGGVESGIKTASQKIGTAVSNVP